MACERDSYTHRPREPNTPYTDLTEEQIRNIKRNPLPFFHHQPTSPQQGCMHGNCCLDRYGRYCSAGLVRGLERTNPAMYIDDKLRPNLMPVAHDYCRGMASVKWGPMKLGERTRRHFFGEEIQDYMNIELYRRPATTYAGRVVMDYGRPGDGYYTQRFPNRASWNCSTAPLNNKPILHNIHRKTTAEHKEMIDVERTVRLERREQWPEYSTYVAGYLLKEKLPETDMGRLDKMKLHAAEGQRIQAEELAAVENKKRERLLEIYCSKPASAQRPHVTAIPVTD